MLRTASQLTLLILFYSFPLHAWDNHARITAHAIRDLPKIREAKPIRAESLDSFVQAETKRLTLLLNEQEKFARDFISKYPPRPDALQFPQASFLQALRVNPQPKFSFSVPNEDALVSPQDVLTTATDEPDDGMDIGLWEDNGTDLGKLYGFGSQPFGNPALSFGTQAPFHMGFYHESGIIYSAAPFLKRCLPEFRIYQYLSLARFAFRSGHPYWGWRFTGWGLHYVQDLTQPYHARVLPGVGTIKMLAINALDMLGFHSFKNNRIQLVSNRHLALENLQAQLPLEDAPSSDSKQPDFELGRVRSVITAESVSFSNEVDKVLRQNIPKKFIDDPTYVFGVTEPGVNLVQILKESHQDKSLQNIENTLHRVMVQIGPESRRFLRSAASID